METLRKPIGYWLKRLDAAITEGFDGVFARHGLSRRHWQVLTSLTRGPATEAELHERLAPFWGEGAITLDEVTAELLGRDWIVRAADAYALTDAGRAGQAALKADSDAMRDRLTDGMSEEDYYVTVDNLERMTANMDAAALTPR